MIGNDNSLNITRGDSYTFNFSVVDNTNKPVNFDFGDVLYFSVKKSIRHKDYAFQIVIKEFENNTAEINIKPEHTKELNFGDYVYDIQLTKSNGYTKTIIKPSNFIIGGEVTDE